MGLRCCPYCGVVMHTDFTKRVKKYDEEEKTRQPIRAHICPGCNRNIKPIVIEGVISDLFGL